MSEPTFELDGHPVPFAPGFRSHSKTSTGHTSMHAPSATHDSQSTATWLP